MAVIDGIIAGSSAAAAALAQAPEGAWICPDCGNLNYPLRETCNTRTCRAARPASSAPAQEREEVEPARPSALVLAPARELAQQIYAEARRLSSGSGLRIVCIYGGVPKGDQAKALTAGAEGSQAQGSAEVVIGTPGRCADFIKEDKFLGTPLSLERVTFLVMDEADRMLQAGFLPSLLQIAGRCAPRPLFAERADKLRATLRSYREQDPKLGVARAMKRLEHGRHSWAAGSTGSDVAHGLDTLTGAGGEVAMRQAMFVTATWASAVEEAAAKVMGDGAVELHIEQPQDAEPDASAAAELQANREVRQRVHVVALHKEKLPLLRAELESLSATSPAACVMIFCKTKKRCDWLAGRLQSKGAFADGGWVRALHSGKGQAEREQVLGEFRELAAAGQQGGVLVATNVASRGLDIPAMALVVIYDFSSVEDYVHQIGRTGRGEGTAGEALAMYAEADGCAAPLAAVLRGAGQGVPAALAALAGA